MTHLDRTVRVADIVLEHSECAQIFRDYKIDFCCRGERTVEAACAEQSLDADALLADLGQAIAARSEHAEPEPSAMATPDLIAYVVTHHHAYLFRTLPFLATLASKVARVHGDHNPKLVRLSEAFAELAATLEPHLREEEGVLFPALTAPRLDHRLVEEELASMDREHHVVGALLARVRSLADDFTVPEWACGSYRTLFAELEALEMDTLRHVHLETHALMPRFVPSRANRDVAARDGVTA